MKQKFETNPNMIGKYINRYLYSDVQVVGKIVGIKSKTIVEVQRLEARKDPNWKPEWIPGGFSAICLNQNSQEWIFTETDEIIELRLSEGILKRCLKIQDVPVEFYDYNF